MNSAVPHLFHLLLSSCVVGYRCLFLSCFVLSVDLYFMLITLWSHIITTPSAPSFRVDERCALKPDQHDVHHPETIQKTRLYAICHTTCARVRPVIAWITRTHREHVNVHGAKICTTHTLCEYFHAIHLCVRKAVALSGHSIHTIGCVPAASQHRILSWCGSHTYTQHAHTDPFCAWRFFSKNANFMHMLSGASGAKVVSVVPRFVLCCAMSRLIKGEIYSLGCEEKTVTNRETNREALF